MKKTLAALTLATIMMFGSTLSFAGIIISDAANPKTECSETKNDGIIIFSIPGIIIFSIATTSEDCPDTDTAKDGIIISD